MKLESLKLPSSLSLQKCYLKLPGEIWSGLVQRFAALFVHAALCEYFRVGAHGAAGGMNGVEQIRDPIQFNLEMSRKLL